MQAIRRHPDNHPLRARVRSTVQMILLVLFTIAVLILGGLVLYLGPDLWVLLNAWMQQGAASA